MTRRSGAESEQPGGPRARGRGGVKRAHPLTRRRHGEHLWFDRIRSEPLLRRAFRMVCEWHILFQALCVMARAPA